MTLEHSEYDWATCVDYWKDEETSIFWETVLDHALLKLNAKDVDELVLITVEGATCIARVIDEFTPIEILDEVIIVDMETRTFTRDCISIKREITFA